MSIPKQLKCPSCGATLNQDSPNQLIVECPYCHQQVVNDTYQFSGEDNEPRVLEFSMTEKEVVEQMVNLLIGNKDVPTDIFDKMKINSIEKYYVPMYIFEGTFRAPWTAERERQEKRQRIGRDGKIEDYYETLYDYYNGEATGNFSVNGIPSNELTRLNLTPNSIQSIVVNPSQLSLFSKVQLNSNDNIEILTPSSEGDSVWWESGEGAAQSVGIGTAHYQTPDRVTSCSASCELKKTSFVYIPLWIIQYKYNDDMFSSVFYAEQFMDYNTPKVEHKFIAAQPTEEQKGVLDNYKRKDNLLSKVRDFGCAGFASIGLIGCVYIHQTLGKLHHYDPYWREHQHDDFNFIMYMFFAGIALLVLMLFVKDFYRKKCGINDIESDIDNRTQMLNNEADNYRSNYKKETGMLFLNKYSGVQNYSEENNSSATAFVNPTPLCDANSLKTKTCVRCSKQIDIHHMYCRYCGAKQN